MINYEIVIGNKISSYNAELLLKYWKYENEKFVDLETFLKKEDEGYFKFVLTNGDAYANLQFEQCCFCRLSFTKHVYTREEFLREINNDSNKCGDCILNSNFFEDNEIVFRPLSIKLFKEEEIRFLNKVKRYRIKKMIQHSSFENSENKEEFFFFQKKFI